MSTESPQWKIQAFPERLLHGESIYVEVQKQLDFLARHREVFVQAFLAEVGCLPSEAELVETRSADGLTVTVHLRKRDTPTPKCPKCAAPRTETGHGVANIGGDWYFVCHETGPDGEPLSYYTALERVDRVEMTEPGP